MIINNFSIWKPYPSSNNSSILLWSTSVSSPIKGFFSIWISNLFCIYFLIKSNKMVTLKNERPLNILKIFKRKKSLEYLPILWNISWKGIIGIKSITNPQLCKYLFTILSRFLTGSVSPSSVKSVKNLCTMVMKKKTSKNMLKE